jgi:hypothetical protein
MSNLALIPDEATIRVETQLRALDVLLGANTPLRGCFLVDSTQQIVYQYSPKVKIPSVLSSLEIALWQFSFAFGKDDFYSYILRPLLEKNAESDTYCAAYVKLRGTLPLSRLLLAKIMAYILQSPHLTAMMVHSLPEHIAQALRSLSLVGSYTLSSLEKEVGEALIVLDYTTAQQVPSLDYALALCIFKKPETSYQRDQESMISLPSEVRAQLRLHFLKAETEQMPALEQAPKALFTHNAEAFTAQNITAVWLFVRSGRVQYGNSGEKPLKSSLREMKEVCGLPEFFPTIYRDFDSLTTQLLLTFFNYLPAALPSEEPLELLKSFVGEIRRGKFSVRYGLLAMFKAGYISTKERPTGEAYIELLQNLPPGKYVSFAALRQYVLTNSIRFAMYEDRVAFGSFSAPATRRHIERFPYQRSMSITQEYYDEAITMTVLRGMMFLFAALGMVEIAYDEPVNKAFQFGMLSYISPFDGLQGVKITELGRFLIGATQEYSPSSKDRLQQYSVIFDEQHLLASIHQHDATRIMQAPRFMNPMSFNPSFKIDHGTKSTETQVLRKYFKMEYSVFLNGCTSKDDVQLKINQFCMQMGAVMRDLPPLWVEFFENVLAKVQPLQRMSHYEVFTFTPSPELMRLLSTDTILRDIVLKAEGYRIMVEKGDVERLMKRLREFGYLMT